MLYAAFSFSEPLKATDMEKVTEYVNADVARLSESQFIEAAGNIPKPESFDEAMEWALLLCSAEAKNARHIEGQEHIHLNNYDGAWCINTGRVGGGEWNVFRGGEDSGLQAGPKITGPINMKIMNFSSAPLLHRWSTVEAKNRRGHEGALAHVVRHRMSYYMDKLSAWYGLESWWTFNDAMNTNGGYSMAPHQMPKVPGVYFKPEDLRAGSNDDKSLATMVRFAYNLTMAAHYEWFVYVKEVHGGVGIKFALDASAAKEVFAMRNEQGEGRKKALVHIVKGHQRNLGASEEERMTWVRRHLRGETKFLHKGAELHIIPSAHDIAMTKTRKKFINV